MKKTMDCEYINDRMLAAMSDLPVWKLAGWEMQLKRFSFYDGEIRENAVEHNHPFFELVMMFSGQQSYTVQNWQVLLSDSPCTILLTPPQTQHSRKETSEQNQMVIIQFALTPVNAEGTTDMEKLMDHLANIHYQFSIKDNSAILKVLDLCKEMPPLWKERIIGELQVFLLDTFAGAFAPLFRKDRIAPSPQANCNWIERIDRMIEISLDTRLSLNEYSARLGLSARQIERIVKRHHGVCFSAYLRDRRLEAAKNMLYSPFASIKNVANSLGYDDVSHFCRLFRKAAGCTPGEFARNKRENPDKKPPVSQ